MKTIRSMILLCSIGCSLNFSLESTNCKLDKQFLKYKYQVIKDDQHYDIINQKTQSGLIFSFKATSDAFKRNYKRMKEFIRNVHSKMLTNLPQDYLQFKLFGANCSKNFSTKRLCNEKEEYFVLTFFEKERILQLKVSPIFDDYMESLLMKQFLDFFTFNQTNTFVVDAKGFRQIVSNTPANEKLFVCYGDTGHSIGHTFCYKIKSLVQNRMDYHVAQVITKSMLIFLIEYMKFNISTDDIISSAFELWYLNCTNDVHNCSVIRYLGYEDSNNIKTFFTLLSPPNFFIGEELSVEQNSMVPFPMLIYFYHNSNKADPIYVASQLARQLVGYSSVVAFNLDEIKTNQFQIDDEVKRQRFALYYKNGSDIMQIWTPKTETSITCPLQLVMNFYKVQLETRNFLLDGTNFNDGEALNNSPFWQVQEYKQNDEIEKLLLAKSDQCVLCARNTRNVQVLTTSTGKAFIESDQLRVVLFWQKEDSLSRFALEELATASVLVDRPIFGSLACHDYLDICNKLKIHSWPLIAMFQNKMFVKRYHGLLKAKALSDTVLLMMNPSVLHLSNKDLLEKYLKGQYLPLSDGRFLTTFTLGVFGLFDENFRGFVEVSNALHGRYLVGFTTKDLATRFLPAVNDSNGYHLITFKLDHNGEQQFEIYSEGEQLDVGKAIDFIQQSSRPKFTQLTSAIHSISKNSFKSLILFFADESGRNSNSVVNWLSENEECSKGCCAFVENSKPQSNMLKANIRKDWNITFDESQLIFINFDFGFVYLTATADTNNQGNFSKWLQLVKSQKTTANVVLNSSDWTNRSLMFDYLNLIYWNNTDSSTKGNTSLETTVKKNGTLTGNGMDSRPMISTKTEL